MNARAKIRTRPNLKIVPLVRKPDPEIVEMLGEIYQLVQQGQICGMAIAAVARDGDSITATVGENLALLGATECLAQRMKTQALRNAH